MSTEGDFCGFEDSMVGCFVAFALCDMAVLDLVLISTLDAQWEQDDPGASPRRNFRLQ